MQHVALKVYSLLNSALGRQNIPLVVAQFAAKQEDATFEPIKANYRQQKSPGARSSRDFLFLFICEYQYCPVIKWKTTA